jgi:hypothetical protein
MLCSGLLGERSCLIVLSSLMAPEKWEGRKNILCKFFSKHVQLYLIGCLLSNVL